MTDGKPARRRKRDVLGSLRQPKVAVMLALGFSSGLPFLLSGNTLGYWLRDEGTTLKAIGFLSWVGLAYSLKFLWAPVIDRVDAPVFGRLGRRRGWMVIAQLLVGAGLVGMSAVGLGTGLATLGALALARRIRVGDPGHRRGRVADRGGHRLRRARPAVGGVSARLSRGAARDRCAHPDRREPSRLADLLHGDGGA